MGTAYSVHRLDDAVDDAVLRVWSENLTLDSDPRTKHRWYYRENPFGPGSLFALQHDGAGTAPRPVGTAGVAPRRFECRGETVHAMLLADFAVDKVHRTAGPALQLQRALRDHARTNAEFLYGFPNPASAPVFRRLGYRDLGELVTYARVLRHAPVVRRLLPSDIAAAVIGGVMDALSRLRARARRARRAPGLRLEQRSTVDPRLDELCRRAAGRSEMFGERSAAFLQWRFLDKPQLGARIATLEGPAAGVLRAYAVTVPSPPDCVYVADFLAATVADLGPLFDLLGAALRRSGVASLRTEFLGNPQVTRALASCGFVRRSTRPMIFGAGALGRGPTEAFPPSEGWYLTQADEDN